MARAEADIITTILAGISIAISFPIAAAFSVYVNFSDRIKSNAVAFGGGIFFAIIAFSLVGESMRHGKASDSNSSNGLHFRSNNV